MYSQIKISIEYPAHSGQFSSWINISEGNSPGFSITNFNRNQTNGDKFRIRVQHPCKTSITTISPEYKIGPVKPKWMAQTLYNRNSYCKQDLVVTATTQSEENNPDELPVTRTFGCGTYTIKLINSSNTVVGTQTAQYPVPRGNRGGYIGARGAAFEDVAPGVYKVEVTGPDGYSRTIEDITVEPFRDHVRFIEFEDSGATGPSYNRGYNAIFCDYNTTALGLYYLGSDVSQSVTFSIAAVSPTPLISRSPVTVSSTFDNERILWDNIPWGTYDITANYGCESYVYRKEWTQKVAGFTVESVGYENSITCGSNDIVADAYYYDANGNRINSVPLAYSYWMLIVDGPAKVGERAQGRYIP
jgi:hypothetical protein